MKARRMADVDMEDAIELHKERRLYLKSIARMVIIVQLPELKFPGSSISNWEVMEKVKASICPNVFSYLKVMKTSMEFLHFEAEAESKEMLSKFINKLDAKVIKLSGFAEPLKVKAGKAKVEFPKKHDWVAFFRDSRYLDESNPGERPDTMHIKGLPLIWFATTGSNKREGPSEQIIWDIFNKYGAIRAVDVPVLDPYRNRMETSDRRDETVFKTFSFGTDLYFEVFIQFNDYTGFENAMQAFKGRKLIHLLEDNKTAAVNIVIDFDKIAHLSDRNIRKREAQRQKLIAYDLQQEEIARMKKKQEELLVEMERQAELRKEEERKKQLEEEKKRNEQKQKIREQKRKLKRIRKKITDYEAMKQKEMMEKKKTEMTQLRNKQATHLIIYVLERISKKKKKEKREAAKRNKELKILHQLAAKKLRKDKEKKRQMQIENEKKEQSETYEKDLRLRLLKNLKQTEEDQRDREEAQKEEQMEKLRSELNSNQLSSVVFRAVNETAEQTT